MDRAMRVRRLEMYPVECVVRGYLSGSGWKEYRESGAVCGIELPPNLLESDKLPEPIFTPATKAEIGDHDENVDFERAAEIVGDRALMEELRRISIEVYRRGADHAAERGIILADTKFEFGRHAGAEIVLGDEVLTPDSSRFWPADSYSPAPPRPPSTSSTCATGRARPAGTRSRRGRSCRPTWSSRRAPNTSRPTSGSRSAPSERYLFRYHLADGLCRCHRPPHAPRGRALSAGPCSACGNVAAGRRALRERRYGPLLANPSTPGRGLRVAGHGGGRARAGSTRHRAGRIAARPKSRRAPASPAALRRARGLGERGTMSGLDPERLLRTLVEHEVDFCVIGAVAAWLQGNLFRHARRRRDAAPGRGQRRPPGRGAEIASAPATPAPTRLWSWTGTTSWAGRAVVSRPTPGRSTSFPGRRARWLRGRGDGRSWPSTTSRCGS